MSTAKNVPNERRNSARHDAQLSIDLILADGSVLPVETNNISAAGIEIICDNWVADEIEPRGIQNHTQDHISVKAAADLPIDEHNSNKLYVHCRIISARRLSQHEYVIGLKFQNFENGSEKYLGVYLQKYISTAKKNLAK